MADSPTTTARPIASIRARTLQLTPPRWVAFCRGAAPIVIGVALAVLLQFYANRWFGGYREKILIDIGINIILAVSLNIVNGYTGQFSIGHAGFMAVGAYTAGFIMYYGSFWLFGDTQFHGGILSATTDPRGLHGPGFSGGDLLFPAALIAGGLVAALFGFIVGLPSLRLRGDYLAIVTLGFGEIVRVVIETTGTVLAGDEIGGQPWYRLLNRVGGPMGFGGLPIYASSFWVWVCVAATVLAAYRIKASTMGRAFLAVRENEIAAASLGVPITRYKVRAFVIAAFFAGVAGGLFAHEIGNMLNAGELGFLKSFDIIIMVVLGGMGSISGAVVAAIVLTILPEALRSVSEFRMIAYALLLIVMMIARPQGLLGIHEMWDLPYFRRRRTGGKTA
ncbi:MAG: branched-chain amino acid ABC transporter permease [Planctomycetes bacterium]|nr:branched-chain amino acid ABC transporter permease [Planctomycetota bacterium]